MDLRTTQLLAALLFAALSSAASASMSRRTNDAGDGRSAAVPTLQANCGTGWCNDTVPRNFDIGTVSFTAARHSLFSVTALQDPTPSNLFGSTPKQIFVLWTRTGQYVASLDITPTGLNDWLFDFSFLTDDAGVPDADDVVVALGNEIGYAPVAGETVLLAGDGDFNLALNAITVRAIPVPATPALVAAALAALAVGRRRRPGHAGAAPCGS